MNGTNKLSLDRLRQFSEIAKQGSFRAAAASLGMPIATLSRHIRDLELELGERLLDRTTRKVQLTASGADLLALIADPLSQITSACQRFGTTRSATAGTVNIATSTALAEILIMPIYSEITRKYPDIVVNLMLDSEIVNMRDQGVDFALRAGDVGGEPQMRKRIARYHFAHYAAASVDHPDRLPMVAYDRNMPGGTGPP